VEEVRRYLENNRHNHSITIYYLLLKKQLRNGVQSQFDINSSTFDPQLLKKKEEKEHSEAPTASPDLEEVQLDRMSTAAIGPRSNRVISRLSHLRESKKKEESVELKLDFDNLPLVDRAQPSQQKKRIHQIILNKPNHQKRSSIDQPEEFGAYEMEVNHRFRQTMAGGFKTSRLNKPSRYQNRDTSEHKRG
jgi:hypothetical protein